MFWPSGRNAMGIKLRYGNTAINEYGKAPKARFVTLWWESKKIEQFADLKGLNQASCVYAIEGCHDAHPLPSVLYVGKTETKNGRRIVDSAGAKCFWRDGGDAGMYAAVWNVVVRFALVNESLVDPVERVLIKAHVPPWNGQHVLGALDNGFDDLVVVNAGEKGRLLPCIAGVYFVPSAHPST